MLRTTIWRDLRWRLLAAALLVALTVALVALGLLNETALKSATPGIGRDYLHHLDRYWFQLPGASAVLLPATVIIAAAGTLMRPARDVAWVLSLPVSRTRWVLEHVGATVIAVAALVLLTDAVWLVVAARAGATLPVGPLMLRSLGVLIAAAMWVGPTLLLMMAVRRTIIAIPAAVVILSYMRGSRFKLDIPSKAASGMLPRWDPWAFVDPRAWSGHVPVQSLLAALLLGVGSVVVALWIFRRMER